MSDLELDAALFRKLAKPEDVATLERALAHYSAKLIEERARIAGDEISVGRLRKALDGIRR